jgi:hypothetical protein
MLRTPGPRAWARQLVVTIDYARRASTDYAGDRFWGQVRGLPGCSRALRGKGERDRENPVVQRIRGGKPIPGILRPSRNLDGKEAAPGSSPGEGLNTCKSGVFGEWRVPLDQGGPRGRADQRLEDSLQMRLLPARAEHLREREGLDQAPALSGYKLAGNTVIRRRASPRARLGDRFWGAQSGPAFRERLSNSDRAGPLRRPFM